MATETPITPRPVATATRAATPGPTTASDIPQTAYVDPAGEFAVSYPGDWRQLTEDEILARLGIGDEAAAEALANIAVVVASSDDRALVAITRLPLPSGAGGSLDEIAQAVQEANAGSVPGIADINAEPITLNGVDAVRISYAADDPTSGATGRRLIRQVIIIRGDSAFVLTFIVRADDAAAFEETFDAIEESWQWRD
ncbi:MAG: hypothetical protein M3354_11935 [Chloroflexota bacterium]|nr:hypothetical protein [Chloroflexota bacterium]